MVTRVCELSRDDSAGGQKSRPAILYTAISDKKPSPHTHKHTAVTDLLPSGNKRSNKVSRGLQREKRQTDTVSKHLIPKLL